MRIRSTWLGVAALVAMAALFVMVDRLESGSAEKVPASRLAEELRAGNVASLSVSARQMTAVLDNGESLVAGKEADATLEETLSLLGVTTHELVGVDLAFVGEGATDRLRALVLIALVTGAILLVMTRFGGRGLPILRTGGQGDAQRREPQSETVSFADVAGAEEAKEELAEVKEFLRQPERFKLVGARIPKGVLLVGPPGTGKTLLARAVAGEAGVPFFSTSGPEFVEVYVGVGARRVRDLFQRAKEASPSIIFIDEIDAVGRLRGQPQSHDEREQTLNQLLVEMDGFDTDEGVVVMAATNRVDVLDPALLRPGRFDRRITVDNPDMSAREAILALHARGKPLAADVALGELAKLTAGFSGADLANLVNEAAIFAARADKSQVGMEEFREALARVLAGPRRRNHRVPDDERRVVAYHEAGHAVVTHNLADGDPVHAVSIVARGQAGGYTMSVPEQESGLVARGKLMATLAGLLGGRAAEEIACGEITTGAVNDMERASGIARGMVTKFGMSPTLGPLVYGGDEGAMAGALRRDYSETVAEEIDRETRRLVAEAHEIATEVLTRHRSALEAVAKALLELQSLDRRQFLELCSGACACDAAASPTGDSRTIPERQAAHSTEIAATHKRPRRAAIRRRILRRGHTAAGGRWMPRASLSWLPGRRASGQVRSGGRAVAASDEGSGSGQTGGRSGLLVTLHSIAALSGLLIAARAIALIVTTLTGGNPARST